MIKKNWVVYLVRCTDNSLYCGSSNDIKARVKKHNQGQGARYTRSRRPVDLIGISAKMTKSEALKLEYRIKRLPLDRKITELIKKRNQTTITAELNAVIQEIDALVKILSRLARKVKEIEK